MVDLVTEDRDMADHLGMAVQDMDITVIMVTIIIHTTVGADTGHGSGEVPLP
jgi:hypothetical protein